MSATLGVRPVFPIRLSWSRITAISGALSLHVLMILLLLVPPVAVKILRPMQDEVVTVRQIEQPKPQPTIPDEPKPQPIKHPAQPHPAAPHPIVQAQPPVVSEVPSNIPAVEAPADPAPVPSAPVETAPSPLAYGSRTHVPYPIEAARRREHGTVILRVLVGTDGRAQTVEIESSSGSPRLDAAARAAVAQWTFRAGTRDGLAYAAWARVPITFDLQTL